MSTSAITHPLPTATNSTRTIRIFRKESKYEFVKLIRTRSFSLATIGFPVMFYVLFGVANRHAYEGGIHLAKYMLAGYACFGLIGAALFGIGVGLSSDLAAGWLELKRASPMPVSAYLFAKCASAVAFGLIIVSILTIIGISFGDVHLSAAELFKMLGMTAVGSISFASMGLLIALLVPANAAPGIINLIYLPMSFLSGLWVPIRFMPHWLQGIAPLLPTYHLSQLMLSIFHYGDSMSLTTHWNALIGFTLLMLGISRLLFHRKEQNA
ncbi:ABC transporter permease [Tunturiibacter gelidoferens]|uniref:Transport permease protein n=2 Tax=Tunturiibacter TaxID=3154218 RepID=A0A7Y9NIV5_9BACT|nr:ABC transporter permease [Edaphobacter lichenicola]NYF50181.1 ABC-2 type transport system permease protein [Edaphobacter lichenicola]